MKNQIKDYLWDILHVAPWAFMVSCGVNVQQNGFRDHSEFLMIYGVVMIAAGLAGAKRSSPTKSKPDSWVRDPNEPRSGDGL